MDSNTKLARDRGQKHVTTACDACRRKRCKCDGQKPCSQCRTTTNLCSYSNTDRRQRIALRQRGISKESTKGCTSASTFPDGQRLRPSTEPSNVPSILTVRLQRGRTSVSSNNQVQHTEDREPQLPMMEQMKNRFRVESSTSTDGSKAAFANWPQVVCRKLLPRNTHKTQYPGITNELPRMGVIRNDRRTMLPPEPQGYRVPGHTRTFDNLSFSSSSISANGYFSDVQGRQLSNFSTAPCLVLPLIELDDSPLGRALMDFQKLALDMTAGGAPLSKITGNGTTDVTLFFRDRRPEDPINVSTWTSEMLRSFRGTFSDELLLACAVCVVHLLRWTLDPTPENYANMPSMIWPTTLQRLKPHPAWVDLMMVPSFRDALTNSQRDWVVPCMKAEWRLLWEKPLEIALYRSPGSSDALLCAQFAAYIDNPQNWSIQRSIPEDSPEIQGSEINIF